MPKAIPTRSVPVYSYDGAFCDRISLTRLAVLQQLGRIARVVTHRKGYVNRAVLLRMPGEAKPSTLLDYVGTKYSFRQHLADGHVAYRFRSLGDFAFGPETNLAPDSVRPIFLRVLLDCLSTQGVPVAAFGPKGRPGRRDASVANVGAVRAIVAGISHESLGPTTG